jgi:hypothetical protein
VYKITGALLAAKLQEVINKGIVAPAGIENEGPVASMVLPLAFIPVPYLKAAITDPEIAVADPVPKLCMPAKEPVAACPAVKITPLKFTGIFAMFYFLNSSIKSSKYSCAKSVP